MRIEWTKENYLYRVATKHTAIFNGSLSRIEQRQENYDETSRRMEITSYTTTIFDGNRTWQLKRDAPKWLVNPPQISVRWPGKNLNFYTLHQLSLDWASDFFLSDPDFIGSETPRTSREKFSDLKFTLHESRPAGVYILESTVPDIAEGFCRLTIDGNRGYHITKN